MLTFRTQICWGQNRGSSWCMQAVYTECSWRVLPFIPLFTYSWTNNTLERIRRTCLKIIVEEMCIDYQVALEMSDLEIFAQRQENRCLNFARKCWIHGKLSQLFPPNNTDASQVRNPERFHINFPATLAYRKNTILYWQRLLNDFFKTKQPNLQ